MRQRLKPSRTYALGCRVILGCLALALMGVGTGVWVDPAVAPDVLGLLQTLGMCIASGGGVSAGALAVRDYGSGGLTSSQGDLVATAQRIQAGDRAP